MSTKFHLVGDHDQQSLVFAQDKRKFSVSMKRLPILAATALLTIACALWLGAASAEAHSQYLPLVSQTFLPTPTLTPAPPSVPTNDLLIPGSTVWVRNFEIEVVEHRVVDAIRDRSPAPDSKMTVVFADVTNHGSRGDSIDSEYPMLIRDSCGYGWLMAEFSLQFSAEIEYNLQSIGKWVSPGRTERMVFVWVLPNAATGLTLEAIP